MENTSENLEHIEHQQHAAHASQFDRRVAASMAIIAALLATVTLLSHRAHNATLRFQSEANIFQTKASDEWNYYQAKNIRDHAYRANLALLAVLAKDAESGDKQKKATEDWTKQVDKYKTDLPDHMAKARDLERQSEDARTKSEHAHHEGDRFDLGELGTELGLVLCSLALLTKRPPFWIAGLTAALLGVVVAGTAFLVH
jgi:hypothetical protein